MRRLFYCLKFRTQVLFSFAVLICFVAVGILLMLHFILRSSYREQESAVLETHGRQIAINIDTRLEYFVSYLELIARDNSLIHAMEEQHFQGVEKLLDTLTNEFRILNAGRVNGVRLYRNGVYTAIGGLGETGEIFQSFSPGGSTYPRNVYVTGSYLNSRNEKVFSIFRKVYQTNSQREYYLEICVYETELYGFFNEGNNDNKIYIFYGDSLISMNDRIAFSNLLYANSGKESGIVKRESMQTPEHAIAISEKSALGVDVLIETTPRYLDKGYFTLLVRMVPVFLVMMLTAFLFAALLSAQLHRRLKTLQEKIASISNWKLSKKLHIDGKDEFSALAHELDDTRMRILGLIEQNNNNNAQMRVAEMSALRAQINSHFLFNSLSSIKWLARADDPDKLAQAVDSLAFFLRYSLAIKENQVLLASEVEQLEAYIHLQSLRYGDEINVQIDIEKELLQCKTVRLILQPLVENAIYHGRRANGAKLNITIYSHRDEGFYDLIVEDDGKGMPPQLLQNLRDKGNMYSESGYGLQNVIERVQMCLGDTGGDAIQIDSKLNVFTSVTIRQPI